MRTDENIEKATHFCRQILLHSFKVGFMTKIFNLGYLELIRHHSVDYLRLIFAELQQAHIKDFGHETNFK
jgi:hypothetical protein